MSCSHSSALLATSALRLSGLLAVLLIAGAALGEPKERSLIGEDGETVRFEVLAGSLSGSKSARGVSSRLLRHLAAGEIEEAALLSTAPRRRYQELFDYLRTVGEAEFKAVFRRYLAAGEPLVEVALGEHRLLIWDLAEGTERRMAGQYFVEIEGRFLLDDVPNATRSRLRQVLEAYRSGRICLSS